MGVIIGMDPHKRSATIEVVDERGRVVSTGRSGTDKTGHGELLAAGRQYPGSGVGGGGVQRHRQAHRASARP